MLTYADVCDACRFGTGVSLGALSSLEVGYNKVRVVPPAIADLTSLTRLDLHGNELTTLPPQLADCSRLKELLLSNNRYPLNTALIPA
jgi:Leucine-rich repeat (LRR) protein